MIDEQSSASGHDDASDRSAIGTFCGDLWPRYFGLCTSTGITICSTFSRKVTVLLILVKCRLVIHNQHGSCISKLNDTQHLRKLARKAGRINNRSRLLCEMHNTLTTSLWNVVRVLENPEGARDKWQTPQKQSRNPSCKGSAYPHNSSNTSILITLLIPQA